MRRFANFLLRNWPLRLGAILLATVLYAGLVLGQNVRTWEGELPVDLIRPPVGATLLADLDPITVIRFRAPLDVGVLSPDSFRATVDLSRVDAVPGGPPVPVPVTVIALVSGVQIVDFEPREVVVRLDPVEVRQLPVTVTLVSAPEGLNIGPPQTEPSSVTVRGASSRVNAVSQVLARVSVDASALNVDRDIELVAVDANGNPVGNLEIDPERARVRMAVARELGNRTLPIVAQLSGTPAPGYRISSITVDPLVVTVSGEEALVTRLENAPTEPIDVEGRTTDLEAIVGVALPDGISVSGSDRIRVVLAIVQERGSQTFSVGVALSGARSDLTYSLATSQVTVTLGGPLADLAALDPAGLVASADVAGLPAGIHDVPVTLAPPAGMELVSIVPEVVSVTVVAPPPTPSPTASPGASPSP